MSNANEKKAGLQRMLLQNDFVDTWPLYQATPTQIRILWSNLIKWISIDTTYNPRWMFTFLFMQKNEVNDELFKAQVYLPVEWCPAHLQLCLSYL